eukprot:COSAG01_NODE_18510_length_1071_cov_1.248971_1_plen_56_part_00
MCAGAAQAAQLHTAWVAADGGARADALAAEQTADSAQVSDAPLAPRLAQLTYALN